MHFKVFFDAEFLGIVKVTPLGAVKFPLALERELTRRGGAVAITSFLSRLTDLTATDAPQMQFAGDRGLITK